jgi:hypothetical protein
MLREIDTINVWARLGSKVFENAWPERNVAESAPADLVQMVGCGCQFVLDVFDPFFGIGSRV